jgi:hypothetical protein
MISFWPCPVWSFCATLFLPYSRSLLWSTSAASSLPQHYRRALSRWVVPPPKRLHAGHHQACSHSWLQAVHDSSRPLGEACCRFWISYSEHLLVLEHHRRPIVPDVHSSRYRLHQTTYLPSLARSSGALSGSHEVHYTLPLGDTRLRPSVPLILLRPHHLHRRWLLTGLAVWTLVIYTNAWVSWHR